MAIIFSRILFPLALLGMGLAMLETDQNDA